MHGLWGCKAEGLAMKLKQALLLIAGDDLSEWSQTGGTDCGSCLFTGSIADGVPDWGVYDNGGYGWVDREIGWYYQRVDWQGYEDLVHVAKAMDAAQRTLTDVLSCLARERSDQVDAKEKKVEP